MFETKTKAVLQLKLEEKSGTTSERQEEKKKAVWVRKKDSINTDFVNCIRVSSTVFMSFDTRSQVAIYISWKKAKTYSQTLQFFQSS